MGAFVEVGRLKDFKNGTKKRVNVGGRELLLAMVDGKLYAMEDICPHLEGHLSKGKLKGTVIQCPLHGTQYDLRDGKVVRWLNGYGSLSRVDEEFKASRALRTYPVRVDGELISIEI